jgi:hypothetical protein
MTYTHTEIHRPNINTIAYTPVRVRQTGLLNDTGRVLGEDHAFEPRRRGRCTVGLVHQTVTTHFYWERCEWKPSAGGDRDRWVIARSCVETETLGSSVESARKLVGEGSRVCVAVSICRDFYKSENVTVTRGLSNLERLGRPQSGHTRLGTFGHCHVISSKLVFGKGAEVFKEILGASAGVIAVIKCFGDINALLVCGVRTAIERERDDRIEAVGNKKRTKV